MSILKKTTIYDIAMVAGVSASTVAAVMNGSWKKRRITIATANRVRAIALEHGYSTNLQARGLRTSNSGLVGMIVPMLDNRYFGSLASAFEMIARSRDLVPAVVSTLRDPIEERNTVKALIAHNVDALFIAGATDPDGVAALCEAAKIRYINVDLPGKHGVSVISDNLQGGKDLTHEIVARKHAHRHNDEFFFIGGVATDHSTRCRVDGFVEELTASKMNITPENIHTCGYGPDIAEMTMRNMFNQLKGLPAGLFVNSTIVFEGVVRFLKTLPVEDIRKCSIGCYDWDPYIELLHFPVVMVRQDVQSMMEKAYDFLDETLTAKQQIIMIPTQLVLPANNCAGS